jgi:hypothetical protein
MKFNWGIIDPGDTTRLWTVDGTDWYTGRFESFWLKRNALKKVEEFKKTFLYVDLVNELTGEKIRLKNNPERICPPNVILPKQEGEKNEKCEKC